MPIYQFNGTDQTGAPSQGTFEAPNEEQALAQLAQYGLNVTQVVPVGSPTPSPSPAAPQEPVSDAKPEKAKKTGKADNKEKKAKPKKKKSGLLALEIGGGPTTEDISIFTRQMSTLVHAGLPLLRSMEVMIKQQEKKPKFKAILQDISEKVSSGGNLSDGLAGYPKIFDNLYVNMVKAGEAGGVLELVLDRLAQFQEKNIRTIK